MNTLVLLSFRIIASQKDSGVCIVLLLILSPMGGFQFDLLKSFQGVLLVFIGGRLWFLCCFLTLGNAQMVFGICVRCLSGVDCKLNISTRINYAQAGIDLR